MSFGRWIKKIPLVDNEYLPVTETNFRWHQSCNSALWTPERKVPLSCIQIDRSLMCHQNLVHLDNVETIIRYFDIEAWIPIIVNPDYFLLDGQHRCEVAKILGLKYMDVVVETTE